MTPSVSHSVIVKVGGSLFDLPDLGSRLRRWLDGLRTPNAILVPGGGASADLVRAWDRRFCLGEEQAHWLALRALTFNAHFLAALVPGACVVEYLQACHGLFAAGRLPIMDMHAWALADEQQADPLPHCWEVSSDSLAAHLAVRAGAAELILLKSTPLPDGMDWSSAAEQGLVDPYFPTALGPAENVAVRNIDFRAWCAR
jgi:aspartokinase-like uncharacterized kinase